MTEYDAGREATKLRDIARTEVHGINRDSPLLEEYKTIPSDSINSVAAQLEKGNSFLGLSSSPQASIRRDESGNVSSIEFHPGRLDLNAYDPRSIELIRLP